MQYIKKSDVIQTIADNPCRLAFATIDLIQAIENLPAADVVEVVRCKDCKYNKLGICSKSENWDDGKQYDPNHFCAEGERDGGCE